MRGQDGLHPVAATSRAAVVASESPFPGDFGSDKEKKQLETNRSEARADDDADDDDDDDAQASSEQAVSRQPRQLIVG